MSFIHYLFLGHFEHDGECVRFTKSPSDGAYHAVVRRPLDSEVVEAVRREVTGTDADGLAFPDAWQVWSDDGYLVCDKYTRNRDAIVFIVRLVERTQCAIYDVSAHCNISLEDWLMVLADYAKPAK